MSSDLHSSIKKISVIGNACAGKTFVSRQLGAKYNLPVFHIDSLQYTADLKIRPHVETLRQIADITKNEKWILDGYGPLDNLEERLETSDLIVMCDPPLWQIYLWAAKRSLFILAGGRRPEMPFGADERKIKHLLKLFKTIRQIHYKMRPEMQRILAREKYKTKTLIVSAAQDLSAILK